MDHAASAWLVVFTRPGGVAMVLEPLSAFSVACNVLQIIELGSKVLNNALDYRKAADGALTEHQDLRNVLQSLRNLNADLRASMPKLGGSNSLSTAENRLLEANAECLRLSNDFIDFLDRLKIKNRHAMLESIRMSIKTLWYKEKMEAMENMLSKARDNLNVAFLVYMNSKQATSTSQSEILRSTTRVEGSILNAVNSSSGSIRDEIRLLAEQLERTSLDATQNQTILQFAVSNRDFLESLSDQLNSILSQHNDVQALTEERQVADAQQKILDSLHFPQVQERRHQIHEAHNETYRWILRPGLDQRRRGDDMVAWLSSKMETRKIYWVCGKPGSGKSTLMRFLDDNISVRDHMFPWAADCTVLKAQWFFWGPGNKLQKSMDGLLRSLLMQLLEQTPNLVPQVVPLGKWRAARTSVNRTIEWTESDLRYSLREYMLSVRKSSKVFLLVDGLDELEGTDEMRDELVDLLTDLASLENVKICLSSRPWNVFSDSFSDIPQLRLEDLTYDDISKYVKSQLRSHKRFQYLLRHDRNNAESLISTITRKAAGVFLWVRLVVRELLKGLRDGDGVRAMWKTLDGIPADLNEYFQRLMDSISPQNRLEASTYLQITLHEERDFVSLHPHRLLDLSFTDEGFPDFVLTKRYKFGGLDLLDREGLKFLIDSTARRLNSRCMGLLECLYEPDDFLIIDDSEISESNEARAPQRDIVLEPSIYPHLFEGRGLLRPFMIKVEFFHRTCRDFLLTPEIQSVLHQYTNGPYDARMFLLNARIAQMMALEAAETGPNLSLGLASYLMSVLSLPSWKDTPSSITAATMIQPVIETLFQNYEFSESSWYIGSSCAGWQEERSSFLTLAIDFDLNGYIMAFMTPEQVRNKRGRPILDYILRPRFAHSPETLNIGNSAPNPELLNRVLEYGANPNDVFEGVSVWALFLSFVADWLAIDGGNAFEKQAYFNAIAILIRHGAASRLPRSWLSGAGDYQFNYDYITSDDISSEVRFLERWRQVRLVMNAEGSRLSEPWYAIVDLLETFAVQFGPGVNDLKALAQDRSKMSNEES
ncbi:MAG: hypothetical protein Q9157_004660 [Trypethelium eluteriae]